MKALKTYLRTFECIGYVQYPVNEGQEPHEQQLPAFISYIDGNLAYLRVGETKEMVVEDSDKCLEYRLYLPEDQKRLEDSDITEIHFDIPTHIKLDRWRKDRNKTAPLTARENGKASRAKASSRKAI